MLHHILHIGHIPFLAWIEVSLPRNLVLSTTLPDHGLYIGLAPHSLAWNKAYPCNTDAVFGIGGNIGHIRIETYSHVDGKDIVGNNHSRDIDLPDLHTNVLVQVVPK